MFDISQINRRYFDITIKICDEDEKNEKQVQVAVEPPKLKVLRQIERIQKSSENQIEELAASLSKILSKNKTGYQISTDDIINSLDVDEMNVLLKEYFGWIAETEKN